jgi:NAD(P)-dependent dehydrogenase (short-subunit alcohol dehydrogenase family)
MPYEKEHAEPTGPDDARPTALQIIKDNGLEGKLAGKVAVLTGSSSGIGVETARALSETGLRLILPVRSLDKAREALKDFFDPDRMEFVNIDHSSLDSVREAAKAILTKTDKISILINNAGIMNVQELERSKDGYELQFATNHLSHFLLFQLLKPALLAGSTPEFPSRVVNLSSDAHRWGGVNESGNYNFERSEYSPYASYAQSKTANIYMANEIERRYGSKGLHAASVHPGVIKTGLGRYMTDEQIQALLSDDGLATYWKSPGQGAATTVWAAVGSSVEDIGGKYLANCAVAKLGNDPNDASGTSYREHAYNPEGELRLWEDSLTLVGFQETA